MHKFSLLTPRFRSTTIPLDQRSRRQSRRSLFRVSGSPRRTTFARAQISDGKRVVGVFSIGQADANREAFYADKLPNLAKINGWNVHWWAWGNADFLQPNATKTVAYLKSKGVKFTTTKETAGGHDWRNWRDYLYEFAPLLFK